MMVVLGWTLLAHAADPALPKGFDPRLIEDIARSALLEAIPGKVEDTKEWDKKKERPGVKFMGQGLGTRLKKNPKLVNHGLWKHYRIEPVDPHKRLTLNLENIETTPDHRIAFKVVISSPLFAQATVQHWVWGVKTFGMTIEGEASATVILDCRVKTRIEFINYVPQLILEPTIVDVTLAIDEFKLTKLGEFPRPLARELSDEARKIAEKYLRKQEHKVLDKANAALVKKSTHGKFVISPVKWLN